MATNSKTPAEAEENVAMQATKSFALHRETSPEVMELQATDPSQPDQFLPHRMASRMVTGAAHHHEAQPISQLMDNYVVDKIIETGEKVNSLQESLQQSLQPSLQQLQIGQAAIQSVLTICSEKLEQALKDCAAKEKVTTQ